MYEQFYGLQGRPFQLTPDPHYYFESATHRKALSYLGYGLAQGEGFIVITGDIGAGKTTLVGHLMQTIDPLRLTAVKIVSTQVEGDDMLRLAAQSFGLATEGFTKAATLQKIEGYLHGQARAGRRTLLIVDEAQNLAVSAIEELRMLSNFQLGGQSLLQIFLLGQPEFRDLLKSPDLEQLRQRVIATHHLEPMLPREVEPYVLHRLGIAGWAGDPAFTPAAFSALYAATGGVPRRLNALLSRVLLLGAIEHLHEIDADSVAAVVADMGLDVDLAPEPLAASVLDEMVEPEELETVEAEQSVEAEPSVETEEFVTADDEAGGSEADLVEAQMWDVDRSDAEVRWDDAQSAEMMDDDTGHEPGEPAWSAAPFAPPADHDAPAPFAPPAHVALHAASAASTEDEWDEDFALELAPPAFAAPQSLAADKWDVNAEIAEMESSLAAFEEEEAVETAEAEAEQADADAPVEAALADEAEAESLTALRHDMLDEIAALRAEIASLRAVQSHAPFAPAQTIDPEALKSCFTLIEERLSSLEFRAEEQDVALRRVLTLLVEWVEREDRMEDVARDAAVA
jgi:general secretion pathway protein A